MSELQRLLERRGAQAVERQLAIDGAAAGADLAWSADDPGRLRIGDADYPVQLLGQVDGDGAWRWAWTEAAAEAVDDAHLAAARRVRDHGAAKGLPELTAKGPLPLTEAVTARLLALAAAAVADQGPYVAVAEGARERFVLLEAPFPSDLDPRRPGTAVAAFSSLVQHYPLERHREALVAYLKAKGMTPRPRGNALVGTAPGGKEEVVATFDRRGRLADLSVEPAKGRKRTKPKRGARTRGG